jgi:hypothetical protein
MSIGGGTAIGYCGCLVGLLKVDYLLVSGTKRVDKNKSKSVGDKEIRVKTDLRWELTEMMND